MSSPAEIALFVSKLPESASIIMVAQGGGRMIVLRSESLEIEGDYPNWPRSVFEALQEFQEEQCEEEGQHAGP